MDEAAYEQLVERIYAASLYAWLWPEVLVAIGNVLGAATSALDRGDVTTGLGEIIHGRMDPAATEPYLQYYHSKNILSRVEDVDDWRSNWTAKVTRTHDCVPAEQWEKSEYCNDFFRAFDIDQGLFIRLSQEGLSNVGVSFGRTVKGGAFDDGAVETARRLQPHLMRAYRMGRTLSGTFGVTADLAHALETAEAAVMVVDAEAAVRFANPRAEQLLAQNKGLSVRNGRLYAAQADTARRLAQLVGTAATPGEGAAGGTLRVSAARHRLPLAVRVTPLVTDQTPIFARPGLALVCVTDLDEQVVAPASELRCLFDLTPAEVRLACAVFEGLSLPEAAERLGVSINTVRTQLAHIFDKTGVTRQAELVKLMMRLAGTL